MNIISAGDNISVLLKDGSTVSGKVIVLQANVLELLSKNDESHFILRPLENIIMFTKYKEVAISNDLKEDAEEVEEQMGYDAPPEIEISDDSDKGPFDSNKIKSLAKLRSELAKSEKEIIINKMRDHTISGIPLTKYHVPKFMGGK